MRRGWTWSTTRIANAVDLADSDGEGSDSAFIYGTPLAEDFYVHNHEDDPDATPTGGVVDNATAGETLTYTASLERLDVQAGDETKPQ